MQTLAGIIESKSNLFDHKNEKTNFRKPKKCAQIEYKYWLKYQAESRTVPQIWHSYNTFVPSTIQGLGEITPAPQVIP